MRKGMSVPIMQHSLGINFNQLPIKEGFALKFQLNVDHLNGRSGVALNGGESL
jgi:hypothetical protein